MAVTGKSVILSSAACHINNATQKILSQAQQEKHQHQVTYAIEYTKYYNIDVSSLWIVNTLIARRDAENILYHLIFSLRRTLSKYQITMAI